MDAGLRLTITTSIGQGAGSTGMDAPQYFCAGSYQGVRTLISVPAGLTRMPAWQFFAYSAAGTFLWTLVLASAGRRLGANYEHVEKYLGPVSSIVAGLFLIFYLRRVIAWRPPGGPQAEDR